MKNGSQSLLAKRTQRSISQHGNTSITRVVSSCDVSEAVCSKRGNAVQCNDALSNKWKWGLGSGKVVGQIRFYYLGPSLIQQCSFDRNEKKLCVEYKREICWVLQS